VKETTRRTLQAIDTAFYHERAVEFAAKRTYPWPGWQIVIDRAVERLGVRRNLRVLDLGCGHGRFATLLKERWPEWNDAECHCVGVDSSAPLLEIAERSHPTDACRWIHGDLLEDQTWSTAIESTGPYDLIVAFGLLHHLPGRDSRRSLLAHCRERLAEDGLVALSFWQFAHEDRFRRKLVSPETVEIAGEELEDGDHLMRWGAQEETADRGLRDRAALRYCHHTSPDAARNLVVGAGLEILSEFESDGRSASSNFYILAGKVG